MHIQTARLKIRPLDQRDEQMLLAMFKNDVIKRTYMIPDFPSDEAAMRLVQRFIALSTGGERLVVGIAWGDELIGFLNETETMNGEIELGYAIHPDYHGKGFMTEALMAVIAELLAQGYGAVLAGAFEENAASIRVMEKCGMKRLDRFEEIEYRGRRHACVYYAARA